MAAWPSFFVLQPERRPRFLEVPFFLHALAMWCEAQTRLVTDLLTDTLPASNNLSQKAWITGLCASQCEAQTRVVCVHGPQSVTVR